jgi:hypothetical protein
MPKTSPRCRLGEHDGHQRQERHDRQKAGDEREEQSGGQLPTQTSVIDC